MATRVDLCNAIRALSMDAVQKANSGHPGAPMGMAEIAEVVWNHNLATILQIHNGLTVTVSYCQTAMAQC
jgi:transketolase